MNRWASLMVELLVEERRLGELDFATAWRRASARARAQGVRRPRDYYGFNPESADDPGWLPFSSFFHEACEREWEGRVTGDWAGLPGMLEDAGLSASSRPDRTYGADPRVRLVA